jgi:hypothetical protein
VPTVEGQHAGKLVSDYREATLKPSSAAVATSREATAREDQAREASTGRLDRQVSFFGQSM